MSQLVGFHRFFFLTPAMAPGIFVAAGGTNPEAKAKERRSLGKSSCLWCLSYRSLKNDLVGGSGKRGW